MQAQEYGTAQRRQSLDLINVRRNPYLVDYEEQKRLRRAVNGSSHGSGRTERKSGLSKAEGERNRRAGGLQNGRNSCSVELVDVKRRRSSGHQDRGDSRSVELVDIEHRKSSGLRGERMRRSPEPVRTGQRVRGVRRQQAAKAERRMSGAGRQTSMTALQWQPNVNSAGRQRSRAAEKRRRRQQVLRRKLTVAACILCIFMIGWLILLKKGNASELEQRNGLQEMQMDQEEDLNTSSVIIQGISSAQYAKHPTWTEDFLPVNEYSRPGETLPQVRDIFVHYTANPGTSAAQNRSYFEQQKDMHEASVSAHFIIGDEGEIIQCVPLDEIAYAVQTRNYDSISIECCYKASDGSFTQETYDSLISLLAWLTETYNLDTSHILRHYDCGGKKCPLYYTENEDAWARLKEDVAAGQTE